ncbi:CLK4-associating serine/arginine-rich protein isoform X2 [Wolffia australiana]
MIDRFDGRALLDFIRDPASRPQHTQGKTQEEEELEEFVNFERYRDLIKHRRRGFADEEGLQDTFLQLEVKANALFAPERSVVSQASTAKGTYSQVGFSYKGGGDEEAHSIDDDTEGEDEDEDDDDFSSDDSHDEGIDKIAREFGIRRYNWLLYKDKKDIEEKKQMEVLKGEPGAKKLSRKERRKASKMEREKERESFHAVGRASHHDPYREQRRSPTYDAYPRSRRSRTGSRSYSPLHSRRHTRDLNADNGGYKSKSRAPKIEFITEFGGSNSGALGQEGISPPSSPPSHADMPNRLSSGRILEALHVDPASGVSFDQDSTKPMKPSPSGSSSLTKLNKTGSGGPLKKLQIEKKETPQDRLKRIMSKQLNKQIKKDAAADLIKKREQERQKKEKLAEASRSSRYSHRSRSRTRSRSRSRSRSRTHSRSHSRSPRKYHRSRSPSWSRSRTPPSKHRRRSRSYSISPGRDKSRHRR